MLEVQKKWYVPNLTDIGWHSAYLHSLSLASLIGIVGLWNLIGAVGFTLCGALGYSSNEGAVYQSGLSTWWGSWAFLIGSVVQIGEAIHREPQA